MNLQYSIFLHRVCNSVLPRGIRFKFILAFCTGHSRHWYWNLTFGITTPLLWHPIVHSPPFWHFPSDPARFNYFTTLLSQVIRASQLQPFFLSHFIFLNCSAWVSVWPIQEDIFPLLFLLVEVCETFWRSLWKKGIQLSSHPYNHPQGGEFLFYSESLSLTLAASLFRKLQ